MAYQAADLTYHGGGYAVKALGDGRVGGYLVPFGFPKDSDGEYFSDRTDFVLDFFGGSKRPVYYHHGQDKAIQTEEIGWVEVLKRDEQGMWCEVQLDMANPRARARYDEALQGKLGFSSGSVPHLVKVEADGHIVKWPIVEASLTPTPAGGKRTTAYALKFADPAPTTEAEALKEADGPKEVSKVIAVKGALTEQQMTPTPRKGNITMNPKLLAALEKAGVEPAVILAVVKDVPAVKAGDMAALMAACEKAGLTPEQTMAVLKELSVEPEVPETMAEDEPKPEDEMLKTKEPVKAADDEDKPVTGKEIARIVAEAIKASQPVEPRGKPFSGGGNGRTPQIQVFTKYQKLDWQDMALLRDCRKARGESALPTEFYREFGDKALKALKAGQINFGEGDKAAEEARQFAIKANELNNTGNDTSWVPTGWTTDLWEKARLENVVASQLEVFEMPNDPYDYPIESTDPTVYAVAEASATAHNEINSNVFTKTKIVTSKVTFNAAKIGLQAVFSAEMEEDSIIPFIPQMRRQSERKVLDAIDNVILNADATTGTGNINYKGANTSAAATSVFLYGGGDGFRHLPLVDNTTAATNHGGAAPTLSAIRALRYKSGGLSRAYAADRANLIYIVDPETYGKLLNVDELLTFSINGRGSTVQDGVVPQIDGSPVLQSNELALTDSTGYAMNDASGTLGQLLIVVKSRWKVGYRRRVATDVTYIPYNDQYVITITARLAVENFDTSSAALLYNINVS